MVGLKTFWITLSALIMLASCVPQTKQTQCGANEAFNSSLRSCVPIVGGPESFVTIDDYSPHFAVTKYKNDYSNVEFTISVSNPYNQTYSIQWERVFNGTPESISTTGNATTISLLPAYLGTTLGQVGTHLVTAKILVGSTIVDTHSFELKINDNPKPTINNSSVLPVANNYVLSYTPLDTTQIFGFTIKNNATLNATHIWKTTWTVTKNGAAYLRGGTTSLNEIDSFINYSSTETNISQLNTLPFNPSIDGVGEYTIRAIVSNDTPGEVVDERTWYVTVKYPPVSKVVSRDLYEASGTPSYSTVVNAYNGVSYASSTAYNFVPSTVTIPAGVGAQADFCVAVADGEGAMTGGSGVRVDWYLDGTTLVYSGTTTAGDSKVCLGDTSTPSSVIFTNPSTTDLLTHTITAKIFDVSTNQEYTNNDIGAGLGTYPLVWNVLVKPDNAAPTVAFTATSNLSGITCNSASGASKTCTVPQDQAFVVGVTATDDFYSTSSTTDTVQDKFAYSMVLYRNGSAIQTCSKSFTDVADTNTPGSDFVGPDYLCSFTVPSYDANGPVNPTAYSYSVAITVSDSGSPISGTTGKTSATYTYNLSPVTEVNTVPAIGAQGTTISETHFANAATPSTVIRNSSTADFMTEGDTLNINVLVSDSERDHHQIRAYLCTDATCVTSSQVATKNVTKTDSALTTLSGLTYTLPENTIPITTPIGTSVPVYFKVEVTDSTHTLGAGLTTSAILDLNVQNKNPKPLFGGTPSPTTATALTTMVGYPLTIDPGTVTDASLVTSESTIGYQWYVDADGGADSFVIISGATSRRLTWTPSNAIASGTIVNLRLCVHDNTVVNPLPTGAAIGTTGMNVGTSGSNCLGNWNVTVRPNATNLEVAGGDMASDVAVWQDTTVTDKRVVYTAYTDESNIYINKTVFTATGVVYADAVTGFETVQFPVMASGTAAAGSVKDLSLNGNADYLIISYQAADSSDPSSPRIKIRKLLKSTSGTYGVKSLSAYPHEAPFGYNYTATLPTTDSAGVSISSGAVGNEPFLAINFDSPMVATEQVEFLGEVWVASDAPTANDLCSGIATGCTLASNATKLAGLINSATTRVLQGYTAVALGSQVQIFGAIGGQYLDNATNVAGYIPKKLGKVVMVGDVWYLTFIDSGTFGSQGYIRILSGSITDQFTASTTVNNIGTLSIGVVNSYEARLNLSNNLVIASTNTSNVARLHEYDLGATLVGSPKTLFGGSPVDASTIRMSSTVSGNPYYYVAAKVLTALPTTYEWMIGRYDASFTTSLEDKFSLISQNAATTTVLDDDEIVDLNIQSVPNAVASTEARLMVSSKAGGATANLYSVRLRSDNKLSCDLCLQHNLLTQALSDTSRIAVTAIDQDMTIGTAGNIANENQKDVFFAFFGVQTGGAGNYEPVMSIINTEVESINSTTSDASGTLGHRPPFFGAN